MTTPSLKFKYAATMDAPRSSERFRAALRMTIGTKTYRRRPATTTRKANSK